MKVSLKFLQRTRYSYLDYPKAYEAWYEYREKSERKHADGD